jgi:hypothetical protein
MQPEAQARCLEPGFRVALRLRTGTAPIGCYVGIVVTTDEHGVRITLVDWLVGDFVSHEMFVPWSNIEMAYVATPADSLADGDLGRWQNELGPYDDDEEERRWQLRPHLAHHPLTSERHK